MTYIRAKHKPTSQPTVKPKAFYFDDGFYDLTETERKQLSRSQFAFGSIYPYTFDGLAYIATHYEELSEEYGREIIKDAGDYLYQVELPFDDFIHCCLLNWTDSKKYPKEEMRRYVAGSKTNEHKFFRCVPVAKGKYLMTQPLKISFMHKLQSAIDAKFPDGLYAYQRTQQYKICHIRGKEVLITENPYPFYKS